MRSAQRRNRLNNEAKRSRLFFLAKLLVLPVLLILILLFFKISDKYWNGSDKFGYVFRLPNGDIATTVLDPKLSEETTLIIPGDTQVDVAGNYGTFRVKNVWQLGIDEKLDGRLLAGTVTKNFLFPVFLWSDSDIESLKDGNLFGTLKFIISPKKTNIPLGDRVMAGLFSLQLKSIDKTEINLGTSKFLQKVKLNDGQTGFLINGAVSGRLTAYFSDNDFADSSLRVEIIDATETPGVSDKVGQVIQVLGGKVVSVEKKTEDANLDCMVTGNNSKIVRKISNLFGCRELKEKSIFDLEIRLGSKFARRF